MVPRGGASHDSGVVEEHNFHRLLLAIMFGNFRRDMQDIIIQYIQPALRRLRRHDLE